MKDTAHAGLGGTNDPSRRLLVSMPAQLAFLPVLVTACRIYCHALPGGRHVFDEVAQAVTDAATRACWGTTAHVDAEFRITANRLEVAIGDELLWWEVDASVT